MLKKYMWTCFCREKKPYRQTLGHKGLVKLNEIIKYHKNTGFDSLEPFSDLHLTILDGLCGKFNGIAIRSQWEGSRKQKINHHALNQILCMS